ncbi:MAG: alpha/beta fold hydrolase [Pirellulales bacterium]
MTPSLALCLVLSLPVADPVDVAFTSSWDGTEQRYVLIEPDDAPAGQPMHVLIALHGHGSDRWQFIQDPRPECRAAREAAAQRRMLYVSPDYRAKTSWMGPAAEADMLDMLKLLRAKYKIDRVYVCGGSMGGASALTFAALHPELVHGVVAMNGTANHVEYDQFQDAIAQSFGGTKQEKPDEYRRRSAELQWEKLAMPLAVTSGGRDKLVPPDSVLRLVAHLQQARRPALSIHRPEGGHDTNAADAAEAFHFVLDPPP